MWFFAPPSAWQRLPLRGRVLVDVAGDRRRADEGDRGDVRMLEQRVDGDAVVAMNDVEDAVGQSRLPQQLGHPERRGRILLRRLEHEAVAARDRRRPHPHGHHRGEVERRDAGDDAERLPDRVDVDAGRRLLGVLALHQLAGCPQQYSTTSSPRVTSPSASESTLPCSRGEDLGHLARAARAASSRMRKKSSARFASDICAPGGERLLRGLDGGVDLLDRREVDLAGLAAGRRVVDRAAAAGAALDPAAADPVREPARGGGLASTPSRSVWASLEHR